MINIQTLRFAYRKKPNLFHELSLKLESGRITGLLGANGAGKTTLLKLIAGSLSPSSGTIAVNGKVPFRREVDSLQQVFFIQEEFALPPVRISHYIKANSQFYPKFDQELCERILSEFQLEPSDKLHQLSHGQRKKFLVTFALATKCGLLILDEPTNGLDIPSKALFRKIVAGSIDEEQLVIISTHQVKDVENLIDNIVVLKDGGVVFHQPTLNISESLEFTTARTIDKDSVLYYEPSPGGYKMIQRQMNGGSSGIDLELLFNAINSGKTLITHES
jgi:ABC-2 type transport system ATP-binding protein